MRFENNATTDFCKDGDVTANGFWVSRGGACSSVGWCESWVDAAAEGEEAMHCDHINGAHEGATKVFMCSKLSVAHPNGMPSSMGTLMGKRMLCNYDTGCKVTKVGL